MNKTPFPKTGLGAAGLREGSIFSELVWWQQGLMRQGLESGSLSDLTPQGLAGADAEGTAALLGHTQPGYPGVEKTISRPRPYVAFKRLCRTLALGRAFLGWNEEARKQQRESHVLGSFHLSSVFSVYCFFHSLAFILFNCKLKGLTRKSLMYLSVLMNYVSRSGVSKLYIKGQIINIFSFEGLMISVTTAQLSASVV